MSERPAESGPEVEASAAKAAGAFRKGHLKLELKDLRVVDGLAMLQIILRLARGTVGGLVRIARVQVREDGSENVVWRDAT